ncbi:NUP62 [Symbiodinium necroappetens]|uniref:NUP62 protein n=1 Tax=Symbiodinium necroappetens TaxID=1628268 RepID=A0A812KHW2_9DINO|nr:NUP62 [Symbiodinium necroappetens]
MPVGTSNKAQNDVIRKKAGGSKKEQTDEDLEFKKKQVLQGATAASAGAFNATLLIIQVIPQANKFAPAGRREEGHGCSC